MAESENSGIRASLEKALFDKIQEGAEKMGEEQKEIVTGMIRKYFPRKSQLSIQNFHVSRILGRGAFGVVYMGKYSNTDVAIKQINPAACLREQIQQELDVLKEVKECSRFISLKAAFFDKNPFLVFELAAGTLFSFDKFTCEDIARFSVQLLEGLAFLQNHKIVHCDIKTTNVLRTVQNNVKLGDLGSAVRLDDGKSFYQAKNPIGTYCMAHGESNKHLRYSFKTDVFGVGLALFEAMTKEPLMQCRDKIDGKSDFEKLHFYEDCFYFGRVVQQRKEGEMSMTALRSNGIYIRETLQTRIERFIQQVPMRKFLVYLMNPGKKSMDIPLATEALESPLLNEFLTSVNLEAQNTDLTDSSVAVNMGTPMTEFAFFKMPSLEDAVFFSAKWVYNFCEKEAGYLNQQSSEDKQSKTEKSLLPNKNSDEDDKESGNSYIDTSDSSIKSATSCSSGKSQKDDKNIVPNKSDAKNMFQCKKCDKSFKDKGGFVRHGKTHEIATFQCKVCKKMYTRRDNCNAHELRMHGNPKTYDCKKCNDYSTVYSFKLTTHMKSKTCQKKHLLLQKQAQE